MTHISRRPKIAFVTAANASNRHELSGTPYFLSRLIDKYIGNVCYIDKLKPESLGPRSLLRNIFSEFTWLYLSRVAILWFWRIMGKKYDWQRTIPVSKYYMRKIQTRLKDEDPDLIFTDKGAIEIAFLKTKIPLIYHSDTTFASMVDYYPSFTNFSRSFIKIGNIIEERALKNADFFLTTSDWAKNSAISYYGVSDKKVVVCPLPANIDNIPTRDTALGPKRKDVCDLFFMGIDWIRKGGDTAVMVTKKLNSLGVSSNLYVCGTELPATYRELPYIKSFGFLDKNKEEDTARMEELFLKSHFFILPTISECQGQVFCEAFAFGLPVIATNTGGISSIVRDGENGILFEKDSDPYELAIRIKELWLNQKKYGEMRSRARDIFESRLSPEAWAKSVNEIVIKLLNEHSSC